MTNVLVDTIAYCVYVYLCYGTCWVSVFHVLVCVLVDGKHT